jgi:lipopolysaccharide transport protein LptA
LIADIEGNTVIFSGNVRVDRGAARITADHLKLYYNREKSADPLEQMDESAFEKMEAYGRVRIQYGDTLAQSESAVYETGAGTLILEGRRATVTKGTYTIEGARVVLNGEARDMTVVGGDGGRVKATIISGSSLF